MKSLISLLAPRFAAAWLLALVALWPSTGAIVQAAEENASDALCVMTYNLRFASQKPPNAWPDRRPIMRECIQQVNPDLIGSQEGVYYQLKELASDLPQYDWIGLGREGGSRGEFMAIFYKKERFDPLEYDHFWLSDTPNVIGSSTWGNTVRRMVTWIRFKDRQTGREFYFWNTHFDHQVQPSREKSAQLVRERVQALNTPLPLLLVGDFNAHARDNKAYDILVNPELFTDSWMVAREKKSEDFNTFNNFGDRPFAGGKRIDWILFKGPVEVDAAQVVTYSKNGQFPSDHFPVVAWMRLKAPQ